MCQVMAVSNVNVSWLKCTFRDLKMSHTHTYIGTHILSLLVISHTFGCPKGSVTMCECVCVCVVYVGVLGNLENPKCSAVRVPKLREGEAHTHTHTHSKRCDSNVKKGA